jgi:hypothetical protein
VLRAENVFQFSLPIVELVKRRRRIATSQIRRWHRFRCRSRALPRSSAGGPFAGNGNRPAIPR